MKDMTRFLKKAKESLTTFFEICKLPHFITTIILIVLAVVAIIISKATKYNEPFLSSVLSNVFAGLITGIAICLISGLKNLFSHRISVMVDFLTEIHSKCLLFLESLDKTIRLASNSQSSRDGFADMLYDVVCKRNDIDAAICQCEYDNSLPINPHRYFIKKMGYDAHEQSNKNYLIREMVLSVNSDTVTSKEIIEIFSEMEKNVRLCDAKVCSEIKALEFRQNIAEKSIF
ncbi:MAG: hypothetical protein IKX86_03910 [Clostridia bacterium]|nr:hypothetical protein [Clostridia bacterium]